MDALLDWIVGTRLSWFVTEYRWVWPLAETVHFCGLTLLVGTVGLFGEAFLLNLAFLLLMGANAALFYRREFARVRKLGPHDDATRSSKVISTASLVLLLAVTLCGRMITFFRPTY